MIKINRNIYHITYIFCSLWQIGDWADTRYLHSLFVMIFLFSFIVKLLSEQKSVFINRVFKKMCLLFINIRYYRGSLSQSRIVPSGLGGFVIDRPGAGGYCRGLHSVVNW